VTFLLQDLRRDMPEGPFDLILCRNLVLTYFDPDVRDRVLPKMLDRLRPGGAFVIGGHEVLPCAGALEDWRPSLGIFRKRQAAGA
jgi:chemotaxis protein methyltransferase CheR